MFGNEYKRQVDGLMASGVNKEQAEKEAPIMKGAQQMLVDWEAGKPEVIKLWKTMNAWVYAGFDETYKRIGSDFDKTYYESETYLLGKRLVEDGLEKGVFSKRMMAVSGSILPLMDWIKRSYKDRMERRSISPRISDLRSINTNSSMQPSASMWSGTSRTIISKC